MGKGNNGVRRPEKNQIVLLPLMMQSKWPILTFKWAELKQALGLGGSGFISLERKWEGNPTFNTSNRKQHSVSQSICMSVRVCLSPFLCPFVRLSRFRPSTKKSMRSVLVL